MRHFSTHPRDRSRWSSHLSRNRRRRHPVPCGGVSSLSRPAHRGIELAALVALGVYSSGAFAAPTVYRIDHVGDGDTVVLGNGQRVRLVQIDTPEVFFGVECYGRAASRRTKALLPPGTRVRLLPEPASDRVDRYGRLLRYVIRVRGRVNVNLRLVAVGAAAPYFYQRERGRYARTLEVLARRARAKKLGLWRACPRTRYNPYRSIATRK